MGHQYIRTYVPSTALTRKGRGFASQPVKDHDGPTQLRAFHHCLRVVCYCHRTPSMSGLLNVAKLRLLTWLCLITVVSFSEPVLLHTHHRCVHDEVSPIIYSYLIICCTGKPAAVQALATEKVVLTCTMLCSYR